MEKIGVIGRWIAENEALLSGLVAVVILLGLILSPIGKGIRRLHARRVPTQPSPGHAESLPATQSAVPTEPLLAVLAFDNLSADSEMQFFSDGVSEDIIQRLSRGATLKVVGRTSSFQFRGERKAEVAQVLNCTHVLDGSIRRAEDRVRINAHLVEASTRQTLWSDRYDRDLEDIFAVQDEIAESISKALHQAFSSGTTEAINPDVYDLYLRTSPKSYAPDELRSNVELLKIVTERAPGFAEAWGRLAYQRAFLCFYQPFPERAAITADVAKKAAHALEFDPYNFDALIARVFVVPPFGNFIEGRQRSETTATGARLGTRQHLHRLVLEDHGPVA